MKKITLIGKYTLLVVVAVCYVACSQYAVSNGNDNKNQLNDGNLQKNKESLEVAPKVSEDASHLLSVPVILPNSLPVAPDSTRYFANKTYDYIITLTAPKNTPFVVEDIDKCLTSIAADNRVNVMLYCMLDKTQNWTYFRAVKPTSKLKKVAVGIKLFDLDYQEEAFSPEELNTFKQQFISSTAPLHAAHISYNYTPQQASDISHKLAWLIKKNNIGTAIVLQPVAGKKFATKQVWDVLLSAGLEFGDGDSFHWVNRYFDQGDDYFLDVVTTTPPGYFYDYSEVNEQPTINDLVFGFSIPRSIAPKDIYEAMYNVAQYAQQRLGGKLTDTNGNALNKELQLKQIETIITNLKKEGLQCGVGDVLYLF